MTPAQVSQLIKRYLDPVSGLCSYLQFHCDVSAVGGAQTVVGGAQTVVGGAQTARNSEELPVCFEV